MQSALAPVAANARECARWVMPPSRIARIGDDVRRDASGDGACARKAFFLSTRLAILLWICA
jgi:hypothetical protein